MFSLTLTFQREHNTALRAPDDCSDRDQPPPNLPEGPAHKWVLRFESFQNSSSSTSIHKCTIILNRLSDNWYVNRDARRLATPPVDVTKAALTSGYVSDGYIQTKTEFK